MLLLSITFRAKKQGVKVSGSCAVLPVQHRLAAEWHVLRPGTLGSCLAQI
jgi:hypothetical protein